MMIFRHEFPSREAAAEALALESAKAIEEHLQKQAQASIVVSGGTTPAGYFGFLQQQAIDWSKVLVLPSDERWVPVDASESNERMIKQALLQGDAAQAKWCGLYDEGGESVVKNRLAQIEMPLTYVLLGMGEDGHTASLFPNAPDIEQTLVSEELCIMQTVPGHDIQRISLTVKTLLNADRIDILMFGDAKKAVLDAALEEGPTEEFPIRAILEQSQTPVSIWWAP